MAYETNPFPMRTEEPEIEEPRFLPGEGTPISSELSNPIIEIRRIPGLPKGFFNAAACRINGYPSSSTMLLGRYAENITKPGEPDINTLAVAVLNNDAAESFTGVWQPEEGRKGDLLEDPRAITLPDGRILIGFTRLTPHEGRYLPFPAVSVTTAEALLRREFPETHLVTGLGTGDQTTPIGAGPNMFHILPGKNAMPLRPNHAMFRREIDNHQFVVFSLDERGAAKGLQYLKLPDEIPYWGELRMGLTMPPAWLNDKENEALLLIHGFNKPNGRLKYHIGSSRLFIDEKGEYAIDNISEEPLLTSDLFTGMFPGEQVQRHPEERDAFYLCGGIPIYNAGELQRIDTYPSLGDTWTAKAIISTPGITGKWRRNEPFSQRQPVAA